MFNSSKRAGLTAVSIIVPNYNHGKFLKERIESILNQTHQDFELILLDDRSTDESRSIINEYAQHPKVSEIIFNETNSGSPFSQWEKGLSLVKHELVWIAESDDFSSPVFLEETLKAFKDPMVLLSYCQSIDVNAAGQHVNRIYWTKDVSNIWEHDFVLPCKAFLPFFLKKNVIPNVSAAVIRTTAFRKAMEENKQVKQFKFAGDWLLWLALCGQENGTISFTAQPLNFFRESPRSTRHQLDIHKKRTRIKEELLIFNSRRHLYNTEEFSAKMEQLKQNWFAVHGKKNIGTAFFSIASLLHVSKLTLLVQYIRFKWTKK